MEKEKLYYYLASDGSPEAVNVETGEILRQEVPVSELSEWVRAYYQGKKVFVHKNTVVPTTQPILQYSTILAEEFCLKILEGAKLLEACTEVGISYATFCKWRSMYEEFSMMVESAKKDRAEIIFERLLDVAERTEADSDQVSLGRLKTEIYKHVSAVGNEKFNPKTRVENEHRVGIVALDTGIPDPRAIAPVEDGVFAQIVDRQRREVGEKKK